MSHSQSTVSRKVLLAAMAIIGLAHTNAAEFDMRWFTIDGGGGSSTSGQFELTGTIGQPDAGPAMSAGSFELVGGFWHSPAARSCPADLDGDGVVAIGDLLIVLAAWDGPDGDITGDGSTDVADLLALLAAWGSCE